MAHKKMYLVSLFSVSVMVIVSVYGSKKQNKTKQTKKKPKMKTLQGFCPNTSTNKTNWTE